MGAEQSADATAEEIVADPKQMAPGAAAPMAAPPPTIVEEDENEPAPDDEQEPAPEPEPSQVTPEPSFTGEAAPEAEAVVADAPKIELDDIEAFTAAEVVKALTSLTVSTDVDLTLLSACCTRVRILCRNVNECAECDEAGAAAAVVGAMKVAPSEAALQLAGLTALVNLSSGDSNNFRRQNVFLSGALPVVVAAMQAQPNSKETQHMGCMALENTCFGDDPPSLIRRREAVQAGGVEAVLAAMDKFAALKGSNEVGVVTLQLMVHRMPELREKALAAGVKPEWLRESGSPSGSSSRSARIFGTFGTSRKNDYMRPANKK